MSGCYYYSFIGRAITFSQSGSRSYFAYYHIYDGKSYRMFTEWLVVEAYYLRIFPQAMQNTPFYNIAGIYG
jgi:hypothetical protein